MTTQTSILSLSLSLSLSLGSSPLVSPKKGRRVVDIDATVAEHPNVLPSLLEAYFVSGCDTVCSYFGIGKQKVISALRDGKSYFFFYFKVLILYTNVCSSSLSYL